MALILNETSLSRIFNWFNNKDILNPVAVITAYRGDKTPKENESRNNQLKSKIKSLGYGWIQLEGVGLLEKDPETGKKREVTEQSLCVIGIINNLKSEEEIEKYNQEFKDNILDLADYYEQDSILLKLKPGVIWVMSSKGEIWDTLTGFATQDLGDYYSKFKKVKTFTFKTQDSKEPEEVKESTFLLNKYFAKIL